MSHSRVASVRPTASPSSGKRVIHLATHGVVDDDAPADSFLALGRADEGGATADPHADGRLTVGEIYGLSLDAHLVVLSACRSAAGRLSGDGVFGMSRALFYAGAASVVANLWEVAGAPSAGLAADFYRRLWSGS